MSDIDGVPGLAVGEAVPTIGRLNDHTQTRMVQPGSSNATRTHSRTRLAHPPKGVCPTVYTAQPRTQSLACRLGPETLAGHIHTVCVYTPIPPGGCSEQLWTKVFVGLRFLQ